MFRGYDLDLLPFINVSSQKLMWEDASSIVKPEVAEKYKENFLRSTGMFRNRLMLLRKKYSFYKGVLRRDDRIMERYGKAIGEEMLDDRVLYAVNGCISHGEKLRRKLDEAAENFSNYCRRHESEDYSFPIDAPASDCEITGVCGCVGSEKPYMSSCVGDRTVLTETQAAYDKRFENVLEGMVEHI